MSDHVASIRARLLRISKTNDLSFQRVLQLWFAWI